MIHFEKFKYLMILKSNISRCQKASTVIFMPLCSPLFRLLITSKTFLGTPVFSVQVPLINSTYNAFLSTSLVTQFWQFAATLADKFEMFELLVRKIHQRGYEIIKTFDILRRHRRFTLKKRCVSPKYRWQIRDISVSRLLF